MNNWERFLWPEDAKQEFQSNQAAEQHRCDLGDPLQKAQQSSLSVPLMFADMHFGKED